jgi:hypothetical protein
VMRVGLGVAWDSCAAAWCLYDEWRLHAADRREGEPAGSGDHLQGAAALSSSQASSGATWNPPAHRVLVLGINGFVKDGSCGPFRYLSSMLLKCCEHVVGDHPFSSRSPDDPMIWTTSKKQECQEWSGINLIKHASDGAVAYVSDCQQTLVSLRQQSVTPEC